MEPVRHDLSELIVLLRKVRQTPCYPWEPFTHHGRVQHNLRWAGQRAREARTTLIQMGLVIPDTWTEGDLAAIHPVVCGHTWDVPGFEPTGTVLDVGAGFGDFAVLASRRAGVKEVYALEPSAHALQRARELSDANHAQIHLIEAAAGRTSGTIRLGVAAADAVSVLSTGASVEVKMVAVDDLKLVQLNLVKINVEGAEMEVLEGAKRTLEAHHPRMAVQAHTRALAVQVDRFLGALGYRLVYHDRGMRSTYPMDLVQNRFYSV